MKNITFLIVLISFFTSCCSHLQPTLQISDIEITHRDDFSSASGVTIDNGITYIVGDDIPYILFMDENQNIFDTIWLTEGDSMKNDRLPYHMKPDYEAMEITDINRQKEIIIISSGSKQTTRDTAIIVNTKSRIMHKKNLRPFYESIKKHAGFPEGKEINIEGLAISNKNAYLFHRGNLSGNLIIEVPTEDFISYMKTDDDFPEYSTYYFNLPSHENVVSGFSGATILPDMSAILFTASMEDMKDEISDGEILGSYIGILPLSGIENGEVITEILSDNNKILPMKLEGISISKTPNINSFDAVAVCDNDDGTSDIIKFNIEIKQKCNPF